MNHPGILTIIFRIFATASTTIFTRSWILWHLPSWRPAQMALVGCFSYVVLPPKRVDAFGRKAMHCFNGCGFWLRTPFYFLFLFRFCRCFHFSATRPSAESFITDFPFAGPEPWHLGEPTSAFWRPSNIPQIKEIMDFRIRSNYSRAFLRIPKFVETNPSEKSEKGNWISVQCWIWMCFFLLGLNDERRFISSWGLWSRSSWWKKCRLHLATSWLSDMGFTRWWNGGYEMDRNDEFAGPGCDDHVMFEIWNGILKVKHVLFLGGFDSLQEFLGDILISWRLKHITLYEWYV